MPALIKKKTKTKTLWYIVENTTVGGKLSRKTLKCLGELKVREAKEYFEKYKRLNCSLKGNMAFCEVVNEFFDDYQQKIGVSKATYKTELYYSPRLKKYLGNLKILEINAYQIEQFKLNLKIDGLSARYINLHLNSLKKILNYAIDRNWIDSMPKIKSLTEKRKEIKIIEPNDLNIFLSHANENQKYYMLVMLHTGMRPEEFNNLTWDDIDFKSNVILIHTKRKNKGEDRQIHIHEEIRPLMEKKRLLGEKPSYYLSSAYARNALKRLKRKIVEKHRKLGENFEANITPYLLRKTFATFLAAQSSDLLSTSKILGHVDVNTTKKYYAKENQENLKKIIENFRITCEV